MSAYATTLKALKADFPFDEWKEMGDAGMEQYTEENCAKARTIFDTLIADLIALGEDADDDAKIDAFQTAVESLNALNEEVDDMIETDEREQLCELINRITEAVGIDPEDYGGGEGLASEWREW